MMFGVFEELKVIFKNKDDILKNFVIKNPMYNINDLTAIITEQAYYVYRGDNMLLYIMTPDKYTVFKDSAEF